MKKILFLTLLGTLTLVAFSQRLRLNAYRRYMFDGGFESNYNPNTFFVGTIKGGDQWGGGFEYMLCPNYCFEVQALHQTTHVPYTYKLGAVGQVKSEDPTDLYTGTVANTYGLSGYSGIYQFGLGGGVTMKPGK